MNPLQWKNEHKVALGLAMIIGCVFGILIGYCIYATSYGAEGSVSFGFWIEYPIDYGVPMWAILGGLVGGGIVYVKRLLSN